MRQLLFLLVIFFSACTTGPLQMSLFPQRALVGEEVTATLEGAEVLGARVWVGGVEAEVVRASGNTLVFRVPMVPGGPKEVEVQTPRGTATATLGILGQVARDRVLLRLPLGQYPRALPQGFTLLRRDDLEGCGFALAELGYTGEALGRALEELEALDPDYKADPESLWSFDSWGAEAIGAFQVHQRGLSGRGVAVAVLDTGVDPVIPQLSGYDFVEEDAIPQDAFPGGHGTGAAGLVKEVAPEAGILPVRVCDENGVCRASRVVRGVCWVVANRQGPTVINLSLGGDTPVEALRLALEAALSQNIPVAAAAGNQGNQGSPAHYPAALDLPGLMAVAALEQDFRPASYSTRGVYVDLSAPGTALECVTPGGGQGLCTGTSFATPLVAGAMALWLEAQPSLTPAQLQQNLEQHARPLPFPPQEVGKGMLDLSQKP